MVGTVQELAILELHEKKFVFVLHLDGTLRIWDLASHSRVFSNNMGTVTMAAGIVYLSDLIPIFFYIHHLPRWPSQTLKWTVNLYFCNVHVYVNGDK